MTSALAQRPLDAVTAQLLPVPCVLACPFCPNPSHPSGLPVQSVSESAPATAQNVSTNKQRKQTAIPPHRFSNRRGRHKQEREQRGRPELSLAASRSSGEVVFKKVTTTPRANSKHQLTSPAGLEPMPQIKWCYSSRVEFGAMFIPPTPPLEKS